MRYVKVTLFLAAIAIAGAQEPDSPSSLISIGDSLYAVDDYAGSALAYKNAAAIDTADFEACWKLGRSLNLIGETTPKDSQLAIFEAAGEAEERALQLDSNSADAHFQLARAVGKIALFKGIFNSIGLAKRVRREAQTALAIDSLHDGAWHVLGRWHREIGKKPKIFRGPLGLGAANKRDAIAFMEKAIAINPANINHHLEMGLTYLEYDMFESARREFELCSTLPPERRLDNKYKEEAKKYLAEMNEK